MILLGTLGFWNIMAPLLIFSLLLFPVFALIDILRHEYTGHNKLIWIVAVLIFPYLGAILYYLIGTRQKIRKIKLGEK
jgi:hypothetical protein